MSDRRTSEPVRGCDEKEEGRRVVVKETAVPDMMRYEWEEQVAPVWRRLPLMADWIEHYGV